MPFIPAANTAKVEMIFLDQGQRCENVYHVQFDAPPSETDLTNLATSFRDWWDVEMQPLTAHDVSLVLILARDLTTEGAVAIEFSDGLPLEGTGAGPLPNNVTVAVKWSTGLSGRSFRGRTYMIGLPNNSIDPDNTNQLLTSYQSSLDAAFELLIDTVEDAGNDLVVASFFHDNAPRVSAVLTKIVAASIDINIDSQRRRLAGRGS
jgi:hypothetical protein